MQHTLHGYLLCDWSFVLPTAEFPIETLFILQAEVFLYWVLLDIGQHFWPVPPLPLAPRPQLWQLKMSADIAKHLWGLELLIYMNDVLLHFWLHLELKDLQNTSPNTHPQHFFPFTSLSSRHWLLGWWGGGKITGSGDTPHGDQPTMNMPQTSFDALSMLTPSSLLGNEFCDLITCWK